MTALCPDPAELSLPLLECCSPCAFFLARQSFCLCKTAHRQSCTEFIWTLCNSVCVIDSWVPLAFDRFSLDIIIHIDCTSVGPSWISAHLLSKPVSSTHQSLLYNNQPSHESTDQQLIISSKVKCFLFSTKTRLYWTYHCSHHQMVTGSHWIIAICLNFIIISEIWAVLLSFNFLS